MTAGLCCASSLCQRGAYWQWPVVTVVVGVQLWFTCLTGQSGAAWQDCYCVAEHWVKGEERFKDLRLVQRGTGRPLLIHIWYLQPIKGSLCGGEWNRAVDLKWSQIWASLTGDVGTTATVITCGFVGHLCDGSVSARIWTLWLTHAFSVLSFPRNLLDKDTFSKSDPCKY